MPEEDYGTLGVTIPEKDDKPIAIPSAFKAFADSVGTDQGKGKLLIAQDSGAAAWESMTGDATLAEDGTLTLETAKQIFVKEATRESSSFGSFTAPVKVTLPAVKAGQLLEVFFYGYLFNATAGAFARLLLGGSAPAGELNTSGASNHYSQLLTSVNAGLGFGGTEATEAEVAAWISTIEAGTTFLPFADTPRFRIAADATNYTVELQTKVASGQSKIKAAYLLARAVG